MEKIGWLWLEERNGADAGVGSGRSSSSNTSKMRSHEMHLDVKVSHLFVTVCVGYITLLIITAAILWYVIHVYQRSYARAIADELYRKSFNIEADLQIYRSQRQSLKSMNDLRSPMATTTSAAAMNRSRLTLPEIISRRVVGVGRKASTESQTEGNQQVDTMFQRMLHYRLSDKNIDQFLAGPNNRSILCTNSADFMHKI